MVANVVKPDFHINPINILNKEKVFMNDVLVNIVNDVEVVYYIHTKKIVQNDISQQDFIVNFKILKI